MLPRGLHLVAASELYLRGQQLTVILLGLPILLTLPFIPLTLIRIFKELPKNFEFFGDAWRVLKSFTLVCFKKKKLMLFVPLFYVLMGLMLGLFYVWFELPNDPLRVLFSLHFASSYFLYSSSLLIPFNILMILQYYAQTGLTYMIVGIILIALIPVFAIGWRYSSAFWKELKSLSPESGASNA